ncbi:MAG: hypothetical protein QN141_00890 [Armatimonadota bacterium]|nr:hypothetical protein [Armatimonadota bacterium]MDR7450892.1 hypothetical protein [Armatimonadota bacterium]MDR7465814.1 hypothetical protein [Armatimonadota bacterium]MDR7493722.1 hypothetical protein [Armatimonadota bacterium]MDR7498328.1 hypothetical protein [Armatimonadota bacterium]
MVRHGIAVLALAALGLLPPGAAAALSVVGAYSNVGYTVRTVGEPAGLGRTSINRLMPWLYLLEAGTYEWGRERGTYQVRDDELRLSGSYRAWGPGKIDADRRITFTFRKPDAAGRLQEFIVVMGYRGALTDYPPPSRR